MTDRPIIFSTPMIRALLAGRKTQTRRLAWRRGWHRGKPTTLYTAWNDAHQGDRLWVREGWKTLQKFGGLAPRHLPDDIDKICYLADERQRNPLWAWGGGKPSIHMPRWASRITLIVEAIKVERLSTISRDDAIAEGIVWSDACGGWTAHPEPNDCRFFHGADPRRAFEALWCGLHGEDAWAANPEVVALTFRVVPQNIDAIDPAPSARAAAGVG